MNMKEVTRKRPSDLFQQTALDRVISFFSPETGAKRMKARAQINLLSSKGGYKGADKSRRNGKNWSARAGSADADTLNDLETLRARSRDLVRNAPLATGAINTVVTSTIGTGLLPQSNPDVLTLQAAGVSDQQIEAFKSAAERNFRLWANSRDCDASRGQTFTGLQSLVFRSSLESGDVFTLRRMITRPGRQHKTALQIIEADRVGNPASQMNDTAELSAGIVRGPFGAPTGYHVYKQHPGHNRILQQHGETDIVQAYYSNGDWQMIHHFTRLRPEQTRGVPYLAPVIEALKQLDRYTEAEIDAAVVSAMFTVFVKTEDGEGMADMVEPGQTSSGNQSPNTELQLGNAAVIDLALGESIETANPGRPNQAFDPFVLAILRQIGVALEIPFELLVKHFTASYSAAQAAILEAWKFFRERRRWMTDSFCNPVWEAVISEDIAAGRIAAPGFFSSPAIRAAWLGAEWIGPPRGAIDMKKEVDAYIMMEDRQYKTSAEVTAELTGGDWESKARTRAGEQKFRRENGLETEDKTIAPAAAPAPENEEEEDDVDQS